MSEVVINSTRGRDNRLCNTIFTLVLAVRHKVCPRIRTLELTPAGNVYFNTKNV